MVAPLALIGLQVAGSVISQIGNAAGKAAAAKPSAVAKPPGQDPARKTAQDFESMFLEQSLNTAMQAAGEDGPLGDNGTSGIHRSMLVDHYAKQISKAGGVGIADQIYRSVLQLQEGPTHG
ncbi:MAG: rod-binding protein [Methylobacteriaceae bacterium]|nr:rod-binding protein [Methylobacteriaceae bacterium]